MVMSRHAQVVFEQQRALIRRLGEAITPATVRFHAVALAAGMWIAALAMVSTAGAFDRHGTLKGVDFLQFYTAARMVADGRVHQLYDWAAFASTLRSVVHGTGDLLFLSVYPPQLALALAPLGRLDYLAALGLWTALTFLLYACCVRALQRVSPVFLTHGRTWWLVAAAFAPFQQLVMYGQVSGLALVCFTAAWLALRRERWFWCGAALGSLAFKPPFAIAVLVALVVSREYRLALGAAAAALAQLAAVLAWHGSTLMIDYVSRARDVVRAPELFEPKLWQMHNCKGFWGLLIGTGPFGTAVTIASSLGVLYFVVQVWKATRSSHLRIASLVVGSVLVNPHLYVYDLVVLAVPLALTAAWAIEHEDSPPACVLRVLVHTLCWLPLAAPLAAVSRVQLTAPCLFLFLVSLHAAAQVPAAVAREQATG
jgi:hypothetical protein